MHNNFTCVENWNNDRVRERPKEAFTVQLSRDVRRSKLTPGECCPVVHMRLCLPTTSIAAAETDEAYRQELMKQVDQYIVLSQVQHFDTKKVTFDEPCLYISLPGSTYWRSQVQFILLDDRVAQTEHGAKIAIAAYLGQNLLRCQVRGTKDFRVLIGLTVAFSPPPRDKFLQP